MLEPRILRLEIGEEDAGKTIKEYLMRKIGFSSKQLSRFKYRRDGILLNGEKRYVNAQLKAGDVLEIRLTQGGEPAEEGPRGSNDPLYGSPEKSPGNSSGSLPGSLSGSSSGLSGSLPGSLSGLSGSLSGSSSGLSGSLCGSSSGLSGRLSASSEGLPGRFPGDSSGTDRGRNADRAGGYVAARDGRLQKIWVKPVDWLAEQYPLKILYEDMDILAADKPSGVVCHPSPGHFDDTLSNQVAEHLGRIGQELDVRVTGRLDKDTSGIVVFALNTETAAQLIKQRQAEMEDRFSFDAIDVGTGDEPDTDAILQGMASGENFKLYIARVRGHFGNCLKGTVDRPLRRESRESFRMIAAEDGKSARTHYYVLVQLEDGTSLIACRIEHGRTHQIRVHMALTGHPIVGDPLYGPEAADEVKVPDAIGISEEVGVPDVAGISEDAVVPDAAGISEDAVVPDVAGSSDNTGGSDADRAEDGVKLPDAARTGRVPLMLHAYRAGFRQPFTGQRIRIEAPLPDWAEAICFL